MSREDRYVTVTLNRGTLLACVASLGLLALTGFVYVAVHEFSYAGSHPHAYGPAKVIAVSGVCGALLSGAVALLAISLRTERRSAQSR